MCPKKINFIPELRDWGLELVVVAMACNGELGTYGTQLKFSTQLTSFRLSLSSFLLFSKIILAILHTRHISGSDHRDLVDRPVNIDDWGKETNRRRILL